MKLAIITLGRPNSGKSSTWYEIFGRTIRSGWKTIIFNKTTLDIYVRNSSYEESNEEISIDTFVRNASFEEYGDNIEDYFDKSNLPEILFCSVQYIEKGMETIKWIKSHNYYIYIQWINPGYNHKRIDKDIYNVKRFEEKGICEIHEVSGKEKHNRTKNITSFLSKYISHRE